MKGKFYDMNKIFTLDDILEISTKRFRSKEDIEEIIKIIGDGSVIPQRMQIAEPEYMCPVCGEKFYINNGSEEPNLCSCCNVNFYVAKERT